MCLFCWQKCKPRSKLFLRLDIFSTFRGVHRLIFPYVPYTVIGLVHREPANVFLGKAKSCFRDWPFVYFSSGFISHVFGDDANTHTPTKRTLSASWPLPILSLAHTTFFFNCHHGKNTIFKFILFIYLFFYFFITQLPKIKGNLFQEPWKNFSIDPIQVFNSCIDNLANAAQKPRITALSQVDCWEKCSFPKRSKFVKKKKSWGSVPASVRCHGSKRK